MEVFFLKEKSRNFISKAVIARFKANYRGKSNRNKSSGPATQTTNKCPEAHERKNRRCERLPVEIMKLCLSFCVNVDSCARRNYNYNSRVHCDLNFWSFIVSPLILQAEKLPGRKILAMSY